MVREGLTEKPTLEYQCWERKSSINAKVQTQECMRGKCVVFSRSNKETAWVELESIMLSEISQAVKDKYHMILPLSGT